jgi:hypothetical protein
MRYGSNTMAMGAVLLCVGAAFSAEPTPKVEEKAPPTTEERIDALEKQVQSLMQAMVEKDNRIADLQRQVGELTQRQGGMQIPGLQFRGTPREMEDMFRNFRRDFFRDDPQADNDFQVPWERELPMGRDPQRELRVQPRPRLGVSLQDPTPDLADRYQNEVKTGAFVIQVLQGSAAQKAGVMVGDCITAFDQRPIITSMEFIEMVRQAEAGKHDLTLKRRGEELVLSIQLGEAQEQRAGEANPRLEGGWLKRGGPAGGIREVLVVRTSALELSPRLAESLKLSADQRRKMDEVLARHAKQLSEECTARGAGKRGMANDAEVGPLVQRHASEAEKELTGVLDEKQLATWREFRRTNNRTSISRSLEQEPQKEPEGLNF